MRRAQGTFRDLSDGVPVAQTVSKRRADVPGESLEGVVTRLHRGLIAGQGERVSVRSTLRGERRVIGGS